MRTYHELPIDVIDESPNNPRKTFSPEALEELKTSLMQRGMIQPIIVRPSGERYIIVAGARRFRAARLAQWASVPALVDTLDAAAADLAAVDENLHREHLAPLEEAQNYQRLLEDPDRQYTIDDLEAQFGKSKAYLYQRLTLLRLIPQVRDLLSRDVLPLTYALKLATVPATLQPDALDIAFRPLFREEGFRRDQLEPLANLTTWIRDHVRRDPYGQDTRVLLPEFAEQIAATEQARHKTLLKVSDFPNHTDRSDPDIILSRSWKPAQAPDDHCDYARPAVIVLGPRQDTILDVCIAKKQCAKHWGPPDSQAGAPSVHADVDNDDASKETTEPGRSEWERREQERRRWDEDLRPHALRLFTERTTKLTWSWPLLRELLTQLDITEPDVELESSELAQLVGTLNEMPTKRYAQVLAVAFALHESWSRESLQAYADQLGVPLTADDFTIDVKPVESDAAPASRTTGKRKTRTAA